ncbi:MAG TPA: 50S ribosomal protein L11 methyltransferase, partial [Solirubrobacteraceae bacterium]|nr:50S ribosomal protein L11 methyltransferase [Solirubrobacteraceae bacterium]
EPPASAAPIPALYVRPPWEPPSERPGVKEIVIDPGQAFGTGAHATTRLCLELMLELVAHGHAPAALLDVGAGSGVLAIAAAHLGFAPVLGLDHERESVAAMHDNALANGVSLEVRHFDLRTDPLPWVDEPKVAAVGAPDGASLVVTANLLRPLLLELARTMTTAPAHLLASGLLREEADEVAAAFAARLGLHEHARRERGEWAALWLARAAPAERGPVLRPGREAR